MAYDKTILRQTMLLAPLCLASAWCIPAVGQVPQRLQVTQARPAAPALPPAAKATPQERAKQFMRGRTLHGDRPAASALQRARHQHRINLEAALAEAKASPRAADLTAAWTAVGPAQVANPIYGKVTGRVTAIAFDPADASGNTLYVGTTGGGVWKSTNAAGPAAAVTFTPLTDTLPVYNLSAGSSVTPSLSLGALAIGGGIVLAGTGDPNDAADSYYGGGILRSADGGVTWTLTSESQNGAAGIFSFVGSSTAGLAFSTTNPNVAVAAISESVEGSDVNAGDAEYGYKGLYVSNDAGLTWQFASVMDGNQPVQTSYAQPGTTAPATAVVWNPVRQMFFAVIRYHGYYQSADGINWTRVGSQPGKGITLASCPTLSMNAACPVFRGTLAVQAVSGDTFALTVDGNNQDQGLYQDVCAPATGGCGNPVAFSNQLNSAPLEQGSGSVEIAQADYDLALAAAPSETVPSGTDTLLYVGTVDLYRCSLAAGCVLRNTTNAENGCGTPAGVFGAQHAIGIAGSLVVLGNDGGIWRSTDAVAETGGVCSASDASHFDNLNGGIGSLAEVVSFAQDPLEPRTLLAGLGGLGTAGSSTTTGAWAQMSVGEGGTVAIDPATPLNWYVSTGPGVSIALCGNGSACGISDFAATAIGEGQVDGDEAEVHTPWLLDPRNTAQMLVGTCRAWRGPADGIGWAGSDLLSAPFAQPTADGCGASFAVVRSLAAGGAGSAGADAPNEGSKVVYAGMAGSFGSSTGVDGHLFATSAGDTDTGATAWTDLANSPVSNGQGFNPSAFDISSIAVDPHDTSGATVYATVMGFAGNGFNAPHLYRSVDAGADWTDISANLPNAPANSVAVDPNDANTLYVALDVGVYVTTSVATCASANCWSAYGVGLPNAPVIQLAAAPDMATGDGRTGELRAATYGRGIWAIPLLTAISPAAPAMTLSPLSIAFGTQQVGTESASVPVTVTNTGNAPLTVTNIGASGDFLESASCVGVPIMPGGSCAVAVNFEPAVIGARTGVLTVYGNVTGGQATATLSGTGLAPASVVLSPLSLSFPATLVGQTSVAENIAISNTGGATATLLPVTVSGDFTMSANTCVGSLAAGTSCTVSIEFAPLVPGARSGTITVTDSVGMQTATLTGTGTSAATDGLTPLSLSFAALQVGSVSAPQQVTLTNSGDAALTLITAQTSGDFSVVNGCGASLVGHSSCSLSVTYAPKSVGAATGTLTLGDVLRTQTVALSGTGLAPPGLSLSPTNGLTFAATPLGQSAAAQAVTLTNNGGVPLLLSSIAATVDFSVSANSCGSSLAVGASCTVQVGFTPTAGGTRTGALGFADNALGSPQSVPLTGVGIDYSLGPDGPLSITVSSGQTATYLLLLSATAGVPGSAAFTCSGEPKTTTCVVAPVAAPLYATGGTVVTVTIATGQTTGALDIPKVPWMQRVVWLALLVPVGLAMRRRSVRALLCCLVLIAGSGCSTIGRTIPGDGSGGGGTPPIVTPNGSYSILVVGASSGLTRSVDLTLVVN